jgi:hypothetical protein
MTGWYSNHKTSAEELMLHWDVRGGVRHVVGDITEDYGPCTLSLQ